MTGKLYIKKRTILEWLPLYIIAMPFFFSLLLEVLELPDVIKYTVDVAWFVLFLTMVLKKQAEGEKKILPLILLSLFFLLYTFIVYLVNFQSPFYFLWGLRNNFRFYIAFFAFAYYLQDEDAETVFKFMDVLFWVNIVLSFIQFFLLGYRQDYLGGIFGVSKGCNAYSIIFLTIILTRSLLRFMNGDESTLLCLSKCAFALVIAALAELKAFFLFFALILFVATLITSFSWKKFILILFGVVMMFIGVILLEVIFKQDGVFTLEKMLELITQDSYSRKNDLGRLTAIKQLSNMILTNKTEQWFGLGLGNCDTSSFAICNTSFYKQYSYLHYNWFSSAFLFLETGYIGLGLYFAFFVFIFIFCWRRRRNGEGNLLYNQMGIIMSLMCVILTFYNSSLRTEAAYMVYFVLALPFMKSAKETDDEDEETDENELDAPVS